MCGCFVVGLGAFFPRIALVLIWLFSDWVTRAFTGEWILPLLGVILLPYTTLSYVVLFVWLGEVEGFTWFFVALAFLFDMGSWFSGAQAGRERYASA